MDALKNAIKVLDMSAGSNTRVFTGLQCETGNIGLEHAPGPDMLLQVNVRGYMIDNITKAIKYLVYPGDIITQGTSHNGSMHYTSGNIKRYCSDTNDIYSVNYCYIVDGGIMESAEIIRKSCMNIEKAIAKQFRCEINNVSLYKTLDYIRFTEDEDLVTAEEGLPAVMFADYLRIISIALKGLIGNENYSGSLLNFANRVIKCVNVSIGATQCSRGTVLATMKAIKGKSNTGKINTRLLDDSKATSEKLMDKLNKLRAAKSDLSKATEGLKQSLDSWYPILKQAWGSIRGVIEQQIGPEAHEDTDIAKWHCSFSPLLSFWKMLNSSLSGRLPFSM